MTKPDFPEVVDSTILGAFATCERKAFWAYIRHQAPEGENIHLHAGTCYAKGLETARRSFYGAGKSTEESIVDGAEALIEAWNGVRTPDYIAKSVDRVLSAYDYYFSRWPMDSDYIRPLQTPNGPAVEYNFTLPLPGTRHPQTGLPILYAGRFDMLGVRDGALFILDDKTTSSLGASWGQQWKLRAQFTGYAWGCREFGYNVAGVFVRGVSILKGGHDAQESIQARADWQIAQWLDNARWRIQRMIKAWESNYWEQALDHACVQFGPCSYMLLCESPAPENYLPIYYKHHVWDPTKRPLLENESNVQA